MKKVATIISTAVCALLIASVSYAADWKLPLNVRAGQAQTTVTIGVAAGAGDGYDAALDTPAPADAESLDAYIAHPEWQVVIGGKAQPNFYQDIRSVAAQNFDITVKSATSPVTVTWDATALPAQAKVMLVDGTNGALVDMKSSKTYSLRVSQAATLIVVVEQPDSVAPSAPSGITVAAGIRPNSMQVSWAANSESDLAGYRIRIGAAPGQWDRIVDLKNVHNYNLFDLVQNQPKYIALSAYDISGNESDITAAVEVSLTAHPVDPVIVPVIIAADGDVDGDGKTTIRDALVVIRAVVGSRSLTVDQVKHADVFPLNSPDGTLTIHDAIVILRKALRLMP